MGLAGLVVVDEPGAVPRTRQGLGVEGTQSGGALQLFLHLGTVGHGVEHRAPEAHGRLRAGFACGQLSQGLHGLIGRGLPARTHRVQGFLVAAQLVARQREDVVKLVEARLLGAFVAGDGAHEALRDVVVAQVRPQRQDQRIKAQTIPGAGECGQCGAGFAQHQDTFVAVHERTHGGHHRVDRGGAHGCAHHKAFALFCEVHHLLLALVQIGQRQFLGGVAVVQGLGKVLERGNHGELAHFTVLQARKISYECRTSGNLLVRGTFVQVREGGHEQLVIHVHAGNVRGQLPQGFQYGCRIQATGPVGQPGHLPGGQLHAVVLAQPPHQRGIQPRRCHDLELEILTVLAQFHGHRCQQHGRNETPLPVHRGVGQPRRRSGRQVRRVQPVHDREFVDLGAQGTRRTRRAFVGGVLMMDHRGQPGGTAHQQLRLTRGIGFREVDAHVVHAIEFQERVRTGISIHLLGPCTQGHPGIRPGPGGVLGAFWGRVCRHESPTHECADRSTRFGVARSTHRH